MQFNSGHGLGTVHEELLGAKATNYGTQMIPKSTGDKAEHPEDGASGDRIGAWMLGAGSLWLVPTSFSHLRAQLLWCNTLLNAFVSSCFTTCLEDLWS